MQAKPTLKADVFKRALEMQRIGTDAARKAQARNRARGIPNFYSIGGRIVSDVPGAEQAVPQPEKP